MRVQDVTLLQLDPVHTAEIVVVGTYQYKRWPLKVGCIVLSRYYQVLTLERAPARVDTYLPLGPFIQPSRERNNNNEACLLILHTRTEHSKRWIPPCQVMANAEPMSLLLEMKL
jgi:hypothetical protein